MCTEGIRMATIPVQTYENVTNDFFTGKIYPKREPAVLRGLDLGPCRDKWTMDYLSAVGGDREVKLHVTDQPQMDFINKNFLYKTLPFCEFLKRVPKSNQEQHFISETEKYYLRSLGDNPRKDVADIRKEYPALAEDITFPQLFDEAKFFSSVFRIASQGIQLWTHYDVMDNLLLVISGRKRVVLFSPKDSQYLYLSGDKSEVLDMDNPDTDRFPEFHKATRYECMLEAGDVLFIPALWFHNVNNHEFGVAVNIFWRHLDASYYDNHDTYGNKDLLPGTRAMQSLDRTIKILDELPDDYRDFYARRLIAKLESRTLINKKLEHQLNDLNK